MLFKQQIKTQDSRHWVGQDNACEKESVAFRLFLLRRDCIKLLTMEKLHFSNLLLTQSEFSRKHHSPQFLAIVWLKVTRQLCLLS